MALTESQPLSPGWIAPEFDLPDTNGEVIHLSRHISKSGLLIVFTCNHCPYAIASWPILKELHQKYSQGIEFLCINANDAIAYPEDAFDEMKKFVEEESISFPYLYDETQQVAKAYQAQCTPDPYLFQVKDDIPMLYYHGRINDNWQDQASVTENNLEDAIINVLAGKPAPDHQPPSMGCSIKWR